jgi:hypothetical protein
MDLDDIVLVGSVREKVRTHAVTANPTGIMDYIKAWGSGEPREPPAGVPPPILSPVPDSPATPGDEWTSRPLTPRGGWTVPGTPGDEWSVTATPGGGWTMLKSSSRG